MVIDAGAASASGSGQGMAAWEYNTSIDPRVVELLNKYFWSGTGTALSHKINIGRIATSGEGSRAITFDDLPANAPARRVQQPALFDFNPRPSTVRQKPHITRSGKNAATATCCSIAPR